MNAETKAVADFLSTEGIHLDIFKIVQETQSDEEAAQQIEDYVTKQGRGPEELYHYFQHDKRDFQQVDWLEIAKTFKSD